MTQRADAIADLVLNTFRQLPAKFKPRTVERREWVPIAGIVLSRDANDKRDQTSLPSSAECVALATGMKCHSHNKLPRLQGYGLHDSHAEVLALRAFNRFLLRECADLAAKGLGSYSKWLQWTRDLNLSQEESAKFPQPFRLRDNVAIHMYCSEAPCGDASMELTMAKQADATPWPSPSSSTHVNGEITGSSLHGRGHFDILGAVRRKPSRSDAPPSLSKSCTDKLALKQCTGLLSSLVARLIWPGNVYLRDFTLPLSEYVPNAWERAFGFTGRMAAVNEEGVRAQWKKKGFQFLPFKVLTTEREFEFSKRSLSCEKIVGAELVPSNRSCVLLPPGDGEVLINGVLEGRKWHEPRGASQLSRRRMWLEAAKAARRVGVSSPMERGTYGEVKQSDVLKGREQVKADVRKLALQGWVRNDGDDEWTLNDAEWSQVRLEAA